MQNDDLIQISEEQRKMLLQALAGEKRALYDFFAASRDEMEETAGDDSKGGWLRFLCVAAGVVLPVASIAVFHDMFLRAPANTGEDGFPVILWSAFIYLLMFGVHAYSKGTGKKMLPYLCYGACGIGFFGSAFLSTLTGAPFWLILIAATVLFLLTGALAAKGVSALKEREEVSPYCSIRDRKYICRRITVKSRGLEEGKFRGVTDARGVFYSCPFPEDYENAGPGDVMIGIETYSGDKFAVRSEEYGLSGGMMPAQQSPETLYPAPGEQGQIPPGQDLPSAF